MDSHPLHLDYDPIMQEIGLTFAWTAYVSLNFTAVGLRKLDGDLSMITQKLNLCWEILEKKGLTRIYRDPSS